MLNWNGLAYTVSCIRSLLKSDYKNFEIILFDNGSEKKEYEKIVRLFRNEKKVFCFSNPINLGYAEGMNKAYKKSHGELIMISNNDMKYKKDCLSNLAKVLLQNKIVGICQPKLRNLGSEKRFDYSLAAGGYVDVFGYPFARGRIFTKVEKDHEQYDSLAKISWCGIFMVKKEVIKKIGFFNSIYFNYGEDMDFCFRAYSYGYTIMTSPSAIAYHVSGGVLKKNMLLKLYFHHRNNLILMLINWPFLYLLFIFPLRIMLDVITVFYYLSVNFSVGSYGILKAYFSLLTMFPDILEQRYKTMKKARYNLFRRIPYYSGSVAFEYFVMKKQYFHQLNKRLFQNIKI